MSEELTYPFTDEMICNQAKLNANGLGFAALAYAKAHALSADDMWAFIGRKFGPGWEGMREAPVSEIAKVFALNWVSFGAEVRSLTGDETQGQVVIAGWPAAEDLEFWGLTREDTDSLWKNAPAAIAEYLGLDYEFSRDGDVVTTNYTRRS